MRVVQVPVKQPDKKPRKTRRIWRVVLIVVLLAGLVNYLRPLPAATIQLDALKLPAASTPNLAWPRYGEAAIGADGYGLLASHGNQKPLATASITKVITALCVLQKKPLSPGQTGPTITIGPADAGIYQDYAAEDGSLIPVNVGEKLSEYQALQALMIPSADNVADTLAVWAFGSQSAYASYARQWLLQNGLSQTHIGSDASGFSDDTTSTANDLVQLGLLAAENPVLMDIAAQQSADLPVVGTVYNYNQVLGQSGITGLKTGNNESDPGAFLFTANMVLGNRRFTLTGAVMGAPSLSKALHDSVALVDSMRRNFHTVNVLQAGQKVGQAHTAWGATAPVIVAKTVQLNRWQATPLITRHSFHPTNGTQPATLGALEVASGENESSTPVVIQHPAAGPSWLWRLTRH